MLRSPARMPTEPPRKRQIAGVGISITDYDEVLDFIDAAVAQRQASYICVAPTHSIVTAGDDPELAVAFDQADVVTPDGMPVVWAARLLGEQIEDRVYGPDLMLMQCERAARSGQRVWLYGGFHEQALQQLEDRLVARFPGLKIVGRWSPPHRPLTPAEESELIQQLETDRPDVVWVGLGMPKQELWMHSVRPKISAPVLIGVGAAFDFHGGRLRQAPAWMQKRGLEWLFRLSQDPRRLLKRYARSNPLFVLRVLRQVASERRARASS